MKRSTLSLMVTMAVLIPLLLESLPAAAQDAEFLGVRGRLYESPTYGYTVVWDPKVWSVDGSISDGPVDTLQLSGDLGAVSLDAYPFAGQDDECVDAAAAGLLATDGVSDVRQAYDDLGNAIDSYGIGGADIGYVIAYVDEDGQSYELVWYAFCVGLVYGEWSVQLTYLTTPEFFSEGYEEVRHLESAIAPPQVEGTVDDDPTAGMLDVEPYGCKTGALDPKRPDWDTTAFLVENVDVYPSSLDLRNIRIGESYDSPISYGWRFRGESYEEPIVDLEPGDKVCVVVSFDDPDGTVASADISYCDEYGCTAIATCRGGCGGALRPRISPGRRR